MSYIQENNMYYNIEIDNDKYLSWNGKKLCFQNEESAIIYIRYFLDIFKKNKNIIDTFFVYIVNNMVPDTFYIYKYDNSNQFFYKITQPSVFITIDNIKHPLIHIDTNPLY